MKSTVRVSGTIELTDRDLLDILKDYAQKNRPELSAIISNYVREKHGYTPSEIRYPAEGLERIEVIIDSNADEGARPLGIVKGTKTVNSAEGFKRTWTGLYSAIGDILDHQRARKKKFISFDDLRAELLEMKNNKKEKLFVRNGEEVPMSVIKHRMAQSQIDRQAARQSSLEGVKVDKKNQGLSLR
jgi:hypothetical protein